MARNELTSLADKHHIICQQQKFDNYVHDDVPDYNHPFTNTSPNNYFLLPINMWLIFVKHMIHTNESLCDS